MSDDLDVVTLGEIEHYAYCARQWALISIDRLWSDNTSTVVGSLAHERVDVPTGRAERGVQVVRAMTVWSDLHGLLGRADVVEFHPGGRPFPIEYKSGKRALASATLQLTAQAICLEEMFGQAVDAGAIWLGGRRRRTAVELTTELKAKALGVVAAIRTARRSALLPAAVFDRRCTDCSLLNHCLPQLVTDRRRTSALHASLFARHPGEAGDA